MSYDLVELHKHCSNHKLALINDKICGCYYCLEIYSPTEITKWIDDATDKTALCPHCGIDAVLGESCGHPITDELLREMNYYWF